MAGGASAAVVGKSIAGPATVDFADAGVCARESIAADSASVVPPFVGGSLPAEVGGALAASVAAENLVGPGVGLGKPDPAYLAAAVVSDVGGFPLFVDGSFHAEVDGALAASLATVDFADAGVCARESIAADYAIVVPPFVGGSLLAEVVGALAASVATVNLVGPGVGLGKPGPAYLAAVVLSAAGVVPQFVGGSSPAAVVGRSIADPATVNLAGPGAVLGKPGPAYLAAAVVSAAGGICVGRLRIHANGNLVCFHVRAPVLESDTSARGLLPARPTSAILSYEGS